MSDLVIQRQEYIKVHFLGVISFFGKTRIIWQKPRAKVSSSFEEQLAKQINELTNKPTLNFTDDKLNVS